MVLKVGDRVEYWNESEGWKPGRILGRDALNQWIVKLDGDGPYKNFRVKDSDAVELLRHSTAPAPDPKPRPRAGYMPEGELARQLEAAKQFKVGDRIVISIAGESEHTGTITEMDSKSFSFMPDAGKSRGYFLNALAFARKIDLSSMETSNRKPYEPQVNDLLWAGEELVKILAINSEQVLLERTYGIPVKYSIQYIRNVMDSGQWTRASVDERTAHLQKQADQLDEQIARLMDEKAKIDRTLAALQGS